MPNRTLDLSFVALLPPAPVGCSDAQQRADSSSNLKELARAVLKYEADNQAWPATLGDLQPVVGTSDDLGTIGGGKDYAALVKNPLTGDNPGYEYVKPAETPESFANTIILYQLRGGNRDESLPVGFLDGSVRPATDLQ